MEKIDEQNADEAFAIAFSLVDEWQGKGMPTPENGSQLYRDDLLVSPHYLSHYAQMSIMAALDHLSSVKSLLYLAKIGHISAPYTILRAVLEMSACAIILVNPKEQSVRIENRVAFMRQEFMDKKSLLTDSRLDSTRDQKKYESQLKIMKTRIPWMSEDYQGINKSGTAIMKEASLLVSNDIRYLTAWRWCSGMAHGREWSNLKLSMLELLGPSRAGTSKVSITSDTGMVASMTRVAAEMLDHAISTYLKTAKAMPINPALLRLPINGATCTHS